jgi:hypothetical protein
MSVICEPSTASLCVGPRTSVTKVFNARWRLIAGCRSPSAPMARIAGATSVSEAPRRALLALAGDAGDRPQPVAGFAAGRSRTGMAPTRLPSVLAPLGSRRGDRNRDDQRVHPLASPKQQAAERAVTAASTTSFTCARSRAPLRATADRSVCRTSILPPGRCAGSASTRARSSRTGSAARPRRRTGAAHRRGGADSARMRASVTSRQQPPCGRGGLGKSCDAGHPSTVSAVHQLPSSASPDAVGDDVMHDGDQRRRAVRQIA